MGIFEIGRKLLATSLQRDLCNGHTLETFHTLANERVLILKLNNSHNIGLIVLQQLLNIKDVKPSVALDLLVLKLDIASQVSSSSMVDHSKTGGLCVNLHNSISSSVAFGMPSDKLTPTDAK